MCLKPSCFQFTERMYADEWAERNVILKDTGRFRYEVTPYFREPTRAASDLIHTCRVILKTPAQCGKTSLLLNVLGWVAAYDPANALLILDSLKTGQRLSKNRLKPFLRDTCHIAAFQASHKDKSKETTNLSLGTGANLIIGSASSASDLCSTPVKYLFADELDRWTDELGDEGDPLLLAFKRQVRFMGMAVLTSTPTKPDGRINAHYLLGTQETWCAICECGCYMRVSYDDINWDNDTPTYACPECGQIYSESDIITLPHEYTKPQNNAPYIDKYGRLARSFEITATLCHKQYTWDALKKEERQAKALGEAAIRSFRNTALGETYTPPTEEVLSVYDLRRYSANYTPQNIPRFVERIVIGIDTQDRAFPYLIIGVNSDLSKIAFIQAGMLLGDLRQQAIWADLKNLLSTFRSTTEDGKTKAISLAAIDSGGHFTQDIYALTMLNPRIRAVKGRSHGYKFKESTIIDRATRVRVKALCSGLGKTDVTFLNTRFCKDLIYTHLRGKLHGLPIGDEWVWPIGFGIDETFFEQLTSEVMAYNSQGNYYYEVIPGRDNHYLDCLVYALGAAEMARLISGQTPAKAHLVDITESEPEVVKQPTKQVENPIEKPVEITPKEPTKQPKTKLIDVKPVKIRKPL